MRRTGKEPIRGVTVRATSQVEGYVGSGIRGTAAAACDDQGRFAIPAIAAGRVTLDLEFYGVNPGMGHGEVAGFEASVVLNRKDFGIDIDLPMETGGAVVGDKVTITLNIEAVKQG